MDGCTNSVYPVIMQGFQTKSHGKKLVYTREQLTACKQTNLSLNTITSSIIKKNVSEFCTLKSQHNKRGWHAGKREEAHTRDLNV